nr:reverse transcriptase [Tanacetum cinerariifolium]
MVNTRNNKLVLNIPPSTYPIQAALASIQETLSSIQAKVKLHSTEIDSLKRRERTSQPRTDKLVAQLRPHPEPNNTSYGKLIRIEFPKFSGNDVKDWVYRCKRFFKVDGVPDGRKIQLASMHMFDVALQTGSVQRYQGVFKALLNKVDLPEPIVVSMFIGGLKPEVGTPIRMFQANTLSEAYQLARIQEATNTILKPRYNTPLLPTPKQSTPTTTYASKTTPTKTNSVAQNSGYVTRNGGDLDNYIDGDDETYEDCVGDMVGVTDSSQITLNALSGLNSYQTIRVRGRVGINWYQSCLTGNSDSVFRRVVSFSARLLHKRNNNLVLNTPPSTYPIQAALAPIQETLSSIQAKVKLHSTEINSLKRRERTSQPRTDKLVAQLRPHPEPNNTSYGKLIRIEFPKFSGNDVKDWVYRCKRFFKVDGVPDGRKIQLASMHMFNVALVWYQQYVKKYHDNTLWEHFEVEVVKKFRVLYDDPIVELKNLKQTGSVQRYQGVFKALLNKVDLPEPIVVKVIAEGDLDNYIDGDDETYEDCVGDMVGVTDSSQITLNALSGLNSYQTMRVRGRVGKQMGNEGMMKQAELSSMALCVSSQVAQVFLDQVYKLHGLPESIVSDGDKAFLSNFWKALFAELKVKLKLSTAYHPQTDGQIELINRSLGCYLRCMFGEKPKDCETAQEIWLRVQQMMKGSDIGIQEKKAKLFNEWERFTFNEGESIESYYHRFLKLINDLKRNKHFPEKIASNLKFLNNLQPEWSRHVTIVHQTKDLHTADYTQLYDFLKYNQKERISSDPRNRQIAQPGMNMGQDKQMQMVRGYGRNQFRQHAGQNAGNLAGCNDVIGNQVNQNAVQNPRV